MNLYNYKLVPDSAPAGTSALFLEAAAVLLNLCLWMSLAGTEGEGAGGVLEVSSTSRTGSAAHLCLHSSAVFMECVCCLVLHSH